MSRNETALGQIVIFCYSGIEPSPFATLSLTSGSLFSCGAFEVIKISSETSYAQFMVNQFLFELKSDYYFFQNECAQAVRSPIKLVDECVRI